MDRQRVVSSFLSEYEGAAAAYSLRALNNNGDSVVRVRRSSDDAEQDFTAAEVSDGTLVNFANNGTSDLYGNTMYFDRVDDWVLLDSIITLSGDFTISWTSLLTESASDHTVLGQASSNWIQWSGTNFRIRINGTIYNFSASTANDVGELHSYTLTRSGTDLTFSKDSAPVETITVTTDNFAVQQFGSRNSTGLLGGWKGIIKDVNINGVAAYSGSELVTWTDTIGSNDGTVNGSPALYSGQGFDGFVATEYDQSGAVLRDGTQSTTTNQPQIVSNGALVTDGNGNVSTIWDGVNDDLDVVAGFAGLTAANVYAVTDNAGVVTLDTLTAQDISADTNLTTILTGITYDKVTAVIIYPDNTNQSAIQSEINTLFGI